MYDIMLIWWEKIFIINVVDDEKKYYKMNEMIISYHALPSEMTLLSNIKMLNRRQ